MNLTNWLDRLAAALQHKLTPLETFEYLQELKTWSLTDDEWLEVKALVKRRHEFFPRIAELQEIMHEIKRQAAAANNKPVWKTWQGEDGRWYAKRPTG